jgi:hypothetical protein
VTCPYLPGWLGCTLKLCPYRERPEDVNRNLSICTVNLIYLGWLLPCLLEIHEMRTNVLVCISCFSGRLENRGSIPGRFRGLSLMPSVRTGSGIHASTAHSTSS